MAGVDTGGPVRRLSGKPAMESTVAIATVIALHLLLYVSLVNTGSIREQSSSNMPRTALVFVDRPKRSVQVDHRFSQNMTSPVTKADAEAVSHRIEDRAPLVSDRPVKVPPQAAGEGVSSVPLNLSLGEDYASRPDFRSDPLANMASDRLASREGERFRMRGPITGKQVIEGAAQMLGLWPPGYTTDPCPALERSIAGLLPDTRPRSRELLREEIRKRQQYCQ